MSKKEYVSFKCNEAGLVSGFPYHDANVVELSISGEISIKIYGNDNKYYIINIIDIDRLYISEIREGNIISDIFAGPVLEINEFMFRSYKKDIEKLYASYESYIDFSRNFVNKFKDKYYVNVRCSYGFELVCLSRKIKITRLNT